MSAIDSGSTSTDVVILDRGEEYRGAGRFCPPARARPRARTSALDEALRQARS